MAAYCEDPAILEMSKQDIDEVLLRAHVIVEEDDDVVVKLTKAIDYGIVQMYVGGRKAGKPIDLYNDGVVPSGRISLGAHELKSGKHELTVEIVGANEKAVKGYMFGLDEIILEKR